MGFLTLGLLGCSTVQTEYVLLKVPLEVSRECLELELTYGYTKEIRTNYDLGSALVEAREGFGICQEVLRSIQEEYGA